ncbi:hypothetical protein GCK72_010318 [Caenorhabditis remanei]|uniref:PUM-HD domain-containing protein n=1 Tax=Caenorhabditis remanei TaxID=31234 RepID=A0A6A5H5D0_CAERE|nr:hypothetical protein GCK72_010318 [Caenorhabditis remanei]KAF1762056.1 hypothetical protein GCK72_010318 [Caenorhabditis remanei]
MSQPWIRRSAATSSGSSSIGGTGYNLFGNGSLDGVNSFHLDFPLVNRNFYNNVFVPQPSTKPPVKLLPHANRRSTLNNLIPDCDNFFFNGTDVESSLTSLVDNSSLKDSFQPSSVSHVVDNSSDSLHQEITLQDVIANGQLFDFALDRYGVKFLEIHYPQEAKDDLHKLVFGQLTESITLFNGLCHNSNGNFIVQKLVEYASIEEQKVLLMKMIEGGLLEMCKDKFACRVIQLSIQKFDRPNVTQLVHAISNFDFVAMCTDQTSIHVVQRIVKHLPVDLWRFFVDFLYTGDNLMSVCRDKYGCRLVQQVIDKLSENPKSPCFNWRIQLLHTLMSCVVRNCFRLSSNEFANYVVQYVTKSSGVMEMYRDMIIEKCLLRNLLSMSQDKYASHVIEGAFIFAPQSLLAEMMNEIFDGYVKDQSHRDALDILLFHQYGNYVVQQMITICTSALMGKEERQLTPSDLGMYAAWYEKIRSRVQHHSARLERFSSGKKIIDSLMKLPPVGSPASTKYSSSFLDFSSQLDSMFPSFLSSSFMC